MPNRKILLKTSVIFLALIASMTLHTYLAQYNPKRLLVFGGFSSVGEVYRSLLLFDPQTKTTVTLLPEVYYDVSYPMRWSPSGRHIVYFRTQESTRITDLFLYDMVENTETQLTDNADREGCVNWSSDGQEIFLFLSITG
jgi:Tol biopolymer transport system component